MDPRTVASKAMPMLREMARLLDFLATDLVFGVLRDGFPAHVRPSLGC